MTKGMERLLYKRLNKLGVSLQKKILRKMPVHVYAEDMRTEIKRKMYRGDSLFHYKTTKRHLIKYTGVLKPKEFFIQCLICS